jgi:NAD(P)H-hydrate repair Nnr-like enzyme with NAD(P)H-hydrate epimerase domain
MTYLLTSAQIRAIESSAIASGQVTGQVLMARAGQAVVTAVQAAWPGRTGPVVVFCGPGNNGGDGYVIARLLDAAGHAVSVFSCGDSLTPVPAGPARSCHLPRWSGHIWRRPRW